MWLRAKRGHIFLKDEEDKRLLRKDKKVIFHEFFSNDKNGF